MKKYLFALGLSVLGATAVNITVNAQVPKALKISSFTTQGQEIKLTHTVLPKQTPGMITFTLATENGKAVESGKAFLFTLPAQDGLTYDLSTLPGFRHTPLGVGSVPTLRLTTSANGSLAFTCRLIKSVTPQPTNQQIFIRTN